MFRVETVFGKSRTVAYVNGDADPGAALSMVTAAAEALLTPAELAEYSVTITDLGEPVVAAPAVEPFASKVRTHKATARVVGMNFGARYKRLDGMRKGDLVIVAPEPENEAHENALRVETWLDEEKLGYLSWEDAEMYRPFINEAITAKVVEVNAHRPGHLVIEFEIPYNRVNCG